MRLGLGCAALVLASLPLRAETLTVAVAANMQYAFEPLRQAFEAQTGHQLQPVLQSSGKLSAQIMNGAPYHVFLSADMLYPEALVRQGWGAAAPRPYAFGLLVIWTRRELDLRDWPALLASPAIRKIALANPKLAPYGREALNVLAHYRLDAQLQSKFVLGESLGQANQYIESGAADLGFTALSVVLAPPMAGKGRWIEVPRSAYTPIAQGALLLRHGSKDKPALSQRFLDFLYGDQAQQILARAGYLPAATRGAP